MEAVQVRKRGRPTKSGKSALTAAQRKRDQRANQRTAILGTSEDGGKPEAEWTLQECLLALSDPKIRAGTIGRAAWEQYGRLMGYL